MKPTRRAFLKRTGRSTLAASLMLGLPKGWVGAAYADDSPETKTVRFGIIALTDCAPIVMAHELGYFKKFGVDSIISKEASWAVIRDKLTIGENQATHMLIGMPLASTMGDVLDELAPKGLDVAGKLKPAFDRAVSDGSGDRSATDGYEARDRGGVDELERSK